MSVTVLPCLPPPSSPLVTPPASPQLPVWAVCVTYDEDAGVRAAPLCGPAGTQTNIVRVHGGTCYKVIRWAAVGWGGKPPLPSSSTQSANEVLYRRIRHMPVTLKGPDGADIVAFSGEYWYILQIPPADTDTLTGACAPYQSNPNVNVYQLNPQDFSTLFTGPSISPQTIHTLRTFTPDI